MALKILLSSTLRRFVAGYDPGLGLALEVPSGTPVAEVCRRLSIPEGLVRVVMVEGRRAGMDTRLQGGERVALFPPLGGG